MNETAGWMVRLAGTGLALIAGMAPAYGNPGGSGREARFVPAGALATPRYGHGATRLLDGRVLVSGGNLGGALVDSAELYDPADGTFAPAGPSLLPRMYHYDHTVLLQDGRVLSMGGCADLGGSAGGYSVCQGVPDAELYDPLTGLSAPTGGMATSRNLFTATVLQDGRVLVAAGTDSNPEDPQWIYPAELYDPASGRFQATGSIGTGRSYTTATRLADGRVLVAGGMTTRASCLDSAELYDPATGHFSPTGAMAKARAGHSATLLPDGRVLIVGGFSVAESAGIAAAEVYDPASGTFATLPAAPIVARYYHTANPLPDGRVLFVGGLHDAQQLASAEIYDPATGRFGAAGTLPYAAYFHSATTLQDGRVLVVGGLDQSFEVRPDANVLEPDADGLFADGFDG